MLEVQQFNMKQIIIIVSVCLGVALCTSAGSSSASLHSPHQGNYHYGVNHHHAHGHHEGGGDAGHHGGTSSANFNLKSIGSVPVHHSQGHEGHGSSAGHGEQAHGHHAPATSSINSNLHAIQHEAPKHW